MADNLIGAALAGQQGAVSEAAGNQNPTAGSDSQQQEPNQPQVNYVTSEQLNAAVEKLERLVQSSTDKSYGRVRKMIDNMRQAGIQNPTEDQARAMLAATGQSDQEEQREPEAQGNQRSTVSPEAEAWIKQAGGNPSEPYWEDIYDAAQEAGVGIITREDPEYEQFFVQDGKMKVFQKTRQFVRAFEQAFAAKKERLSQQEGTQNNHQGANLASSPALGAGGTKSSFIDPKTTSASQLITQGLRV